MRERIKINDKQNKIKTVILLFLVVIAISVFITILSQTNLTAFAYEEYIVEDLDGVPLEGQTDYLSCSVVYNRGGKGYFRLPKRDYSTVSYCPSWKFSNNDYQSVDYTLYYINACLIYIDDSGTEVRYPIDGDFFYGRFLEDSDSNYYYMSIIELMTDGVKEPPSEYLFGNYGISITFCYEYRDQLDYLPPNYDTLGYKVFRDYSLSSYVVNFEYPCDGVYLPADPVKEGYTFDGWYYDEEYQKPYKFQIVAEDTKLYAKMTPNVYTIDYIVGNGVTLDGKGTYTIEDETYTLPIPKKPGHEFKGWYTNGSCTGEAVTEITKGSIGNKTFYAKFEIESYTVTFYVDGEVYMEMEVIYGARLLDLYLVDPATMTAVAFSLTADMTTAFDVATVIEEDLTLYSDSAFLIYVGLTYNIDGEETMDLLDYNSSLSKLRVPEKEGYNFDGWYYDSEFKQAVNENDKLTSNTTIYAKFKAKTSTTIKAKLGEFFGNTKVFFQKWWWTFAVGGGVILVAAIVGVVFVKRR